MASSAKFPARTACAISAARPVPRAPSGGAASAGFGSVSMKILKSTLIALSALLPALSLAASDMYLKIDDIKGESQVIGCGAGACVVPPLATGDYTV